MPRPVPLAILPVPLAAPTPTSLPATPAPLPTLPAASMGWRVTRSPAPLPTPLAAAPVPLAVPLPMSPAPLPTSLPGLRGWGWVGVCVCAGVWGEAGGFWGFWARTFRVQIAKVKVRNGRDSGRNTRRTDGPSFYDLDATGRGLGAFCAGWILWRAVSTEDESWYRSAHPTFYAEGIRERGRYEEGLLGSSVP